MKQHQFRRMKPPNEDISHSAQPTPDQVKADQPPQAQASDEAVPGPTQAPGQRLPSNFNAGNQLSSHAQAQNGPRKIPDSISDHDTVQTPAASRPITPRPTNGATPFSQLQNGASPQREAPYNAGAAPGPQYHSGTPQPTPPRNHPSQAGILYQREPDYSNSSKPTMPAITSYPAPPSRHNGPALLHSSGYVVHPAAGGTAPYTHGPSSPSPSGNYGTGSSSNGKPPGNGARKRSKLPLWSRMLIGLLVALMILGGGGYWYYQANYASTVNDIVGHSAIHTVINEGNTTDNQTSGDVLAGGRMNILLLGSDNDTKFNAPLAQTDIIVTIDPQTYYVGMLSIPRDMQVQDPVNGGTHKLDEVFGLGWQGNNFADQVASAAGRSIDTIQANFGIKINHYAWVGLEGFAKVIDTAGGVDIDATHPMVDDLYPKDVNNKHGSATDYTRLYIPPGPQHMNGLQALEYVRTRHADQAGDFGRSARQQQVLSQLKIKLATPAIISQLPNLAQDLDGTIQTDLSLNQLIQLGDFAHTIDANKVDKVTFSPPFYSTPIDGTTNFAPICQKVLPQIQKMFGAAGNCLPQVSNSPAQGLATTAPHTNQAMSQETFGTTKQAQQSSAWQAMSANSDSINPVTGIHTMLDVMFLVAFESPDAAKV